MATNVQNNQIDRNDKRVLWMIIAVIVAALLGYAAYAIYNDGAQNNTDAITTDGAARNARQ
jgi:hypothetical protein